MNKALTVAKREYLYNLKRPAFLFAAFGTPLLIILVTLASALLASNDEELGDYGPVGYVDQSGLIDTNVTVEDYPALFTPFESEEEARAALDEQTIDAYMVVPAAYLLSGRVNLYTTGETPDQLTDAIEQLMIANLKSGIDSTLPLERIQNPAKLTLETLDSGRVLNEGAVILMFMLPMGFTALFFIAAMTTSTFLMAGLVEERTNRIMEVLVTSITPMQLLTGKILGLGLLGLTQVVILIIATIIGLVIGERTEALIGMEIPFDLFLLSIVYFILAYFLIASILAAIGSVSNTEQESRQISGVVSLLFVAPYFAMVSFIVDPNGTLPMIMSFIPFTAPSAIMLRMSLTTVPFWQIALSMAIMAVTIVLTIWASAKVFRWGLLLYGKPFSPREILRVIFSRSDQMATKPAGAVE